MFCGGIFACKPNTEDLFICADGVEMNQSELLNIVRGVLSLLHSHPLDPKGRKVLFVEAANTYIRQYRGYIFGASTYHNLSIPLLTSTMERVLNCANAVFNGSGDIDMMDYSNRSTFFHCVRQLLTNSAGAPLNASFLRTFNLVHDMSMNSGMSIQMEPQASGDFQKTAQNPDEKSKGDESGTETSQTELSSNLSTSEVSIPPSDSFTSELDGDLSQSKNGSIAYKISQTVTFQVQNSMMTNIECSNILRISTKGAPEVGPLLFAVVPANIVINPKVNTNIIEDSDTSGIYKCDKPFELLNTMEKVLLFNAEIKESPPPFQITRTYVTNGPTCKITFVIKTQYEMNDIMIGFDDAGFQNARSDDSKAWYSGSNCLVAPQGNNKGEIVAHVTGDVNDNYIPPSTLQLRCTIVGTTLGDFFVKAHPSYNYSVKASRFKLFISRSFWDLPVQ